MTDATKEKKPATVPEAKQAGEARDRWEWVEPTVWTERMLSALEEGVKGGKWYSLMDKVYRLPNLMSAYKEVKRRKGGAGVDHETIEMFERDLIENLTKISSGACERRIPAASNKANVDRETGEPGEEAAGNTDGERSDSASRSATRTGADL